MKTLISFLITLITVAFMATPFSAQLGVPAPFGFAVLFALIVAAGVVSFHVQRTRPTSRNLFTADLNKQIWINQIMEKFYGGGGHIMRSQDMSAFVNNNSIHLADAGVDPEVLVNNTTYPIGIDERSDSDLELPLDRFDTKNTVVRDAEAVELAYNKMESVIRGHRAKLLEETIRRATHAWAPSQNADYTPVLATTGSNRADSVGKALTLFDIAAAQKAFDDLNVPEYGRILVLSPQHRQDLLNEDKALFKAFAQLSTGNIFPLFGFDIYVSSLTAKFNKSTGVKVALDATAAGTDVASSLFYHEAEVMKADGVVDMYSRLKDPEARGDIIGFSKRFVGLPIRNKYIGSIYTAPTA